MKWVYLTERLPSEFLLTIFMWESDNSILRTTLHKLNDCGLIEKGMTGIKWLEEVASTASPVSDAVELIKAYDEYIQLLSNNPAESIAYVHGFRHSDADIEKGKALREKISLLKISPTPTNVQEQGQAAIGKCKYCGKEFNNPAGGIFCSISCFDIVNGSLNK